MVTQQARETSVLVGAAGDVQVTAVEEAGAVRHLVYNREPVLDGAGQAVYTWDGKNRSVPSWNEFYAWVATTYHGAAG